jgi:hypothetical protein
MPPVRCFFEAQKAGKYATTKVPKGYGDAPVFERNQSD